MDLWFVFAGENYYPKGGAEDFVKAVATQADAEREAITIRKADPKQRRWATIARFDGTRFTDHAVALYPDELAMFEHTLPNGDIIEYREFVVS